MEKTRKKYARHISRHSAQEKARAVLSVWTERRKPAQVCKEMEIQWAMLNHWQNRALEGMMQALEPRTKLEQGAALSPRLQAFLEKKQRSLAQQQVHAVKLENRLTKIQEQKAPPPEKDTKTNKSTKKK